MNENNHTFSELKTPSVSRGLGDLWVTSDPHFHHTKIIATANRPFRDVEHMDEALVTYYNEVVKPKDHVIIMGDVVWGTTRKDHAILSQLHGTKELILGNHDPIGPKNTELLRHFEKIHLWKKDKKHMMLLSHVPLHESQLTTGGSMLDPNTPKMVQIHGHTHESGSPPGPYRSVCVEMTGYKPVAYEELTQWSSEWHSRSSSQSQTAA